MDAGLPGLLLIEPQVHADERGHFLETWQKERYRAAGISAEFVQSNSARSARGVLRGLHYQLPHPQGKLVMVTRGAVFDVCVDVRRGSPTFGKWEGIVLSEENHLQLYVPEGFAHGYCVLSDVADFFYFCTDFYSAPDDRGIRWDDPEIGIDWPRGDYIISDKDGNLPLLKDAMDNLPTYTD
jgi:dTDP-4-dehydrorhamnose 3,5-epimerase